jgi:helix-turn-helix protein
MPSKHELIDLFLTNKHLDKLTRGQNAQLSHDELHDAMTKAPNAQMQVLQKHVTKLINAHKNKKGVRIQHDAVIGGNINYHE